MMKMLSKIKLLIIIGCLFVATNAWAWNCPKDFQKLLGSPREQSVRVAKGSAPNAPDNAKQVYAEIQSIQNKLSEMCNEACEKRWICMDNHQIAYMQEHGIYDEYKSLLEQFKQQDHYLTLIPKSHPCGEDFPYGCPTGQVCRVHHTSISPDAFSDTQQESSTCEDVDKKTYWGSSSEVEESQVSSRVTSYGGVSATSQVIDADGDVHTKTFSLFDGYKGLDDFNNGIFEDEPNPRSNAPFCNIKSLKESYMSNCYSCTIVAVMINTFLTVADKTAPLTQEAGVKLMIIGMFLWIAFYVLKQIATLVAPEPMIVVQDLLKFLFKCLIAYTLITSGLGVISKMIVNPILGFGAEYGNIVIDSATPEVAELNKYGDFDVKEYNSDLISADVFGKIMRLSKKADAAVSLNFVIGDALTCHAHHAGAITIAKKIHDMVGIEFYFPNIWLWLCGIAIWVMGLMVVIGINFYLLDLSFKVGFGLLALPITLGLMPFDKFQDKFTACIKIIVNAAGTFMFLGITVGVSVVLISAGLGGTDELFHAIETDNKRYVAEQFSFTGAKFLLVAFAFLYSHKLISETVSKLTSKFFDSVTGSLNHMHTMAVGTTSYLGNAVKDKVGGTVGRITKGIGKGVDNLTAGALGAAAKGLRRGGRAIGRRFGKSGGSE